MNDEERAHKLLADLDAIDGTWAQYDTYALPIIKVFADEIREECAMNIEQMVKDAWNQGYETCWASGYQARKAK